MSAAALQLLLVRRDKLLRFYTSCEACEILLWHFPDLGEGVLPEDVVPCHPIPFNVSLDAHGSAYRKRNDGSTSS